MKCPRCDSTVVFPAATPEDKHTCHICDYKWRDEKNGGARAKLEVGSELRVVALHSAFGIWDEGNNRFVRSPRTDKMLTRDTLESSNRLLRGIEYVRDRFPDPENGP